MVLDCIQWRRTVEDVGIEELYRRIDPFDVRNAGLQPPSHTPSPFLALVACLTSVVLFYRTVPRAGGRL